MLVILVAAWPQLSGSYTLTVGDNQGHFVERIPTDYILFKKYNTIYEYVTIHANISHRLAVRRKYCNVSDSHPPVLRSTGPPCLGERYFDP